MSTPAWSRRVAKAAAALTAVILLTPAAAVALTPAAAVALTPAVAVAQDGLSISSDTRITVAGTPSRVTGTVRLTLRHTGSGASRSVDSFDVRLPRGAIPLTAVSGGVTLDRPVFRSNVDARISRYRVSFPHLESGQSRTIEVTFFLPGDPIRSRSATRVGPYYATFGAFAEGDKGKARLTITAPSWMVFDSNDPDLVGSVTGSTMTATTSTNNDPRGISAYASLLGQSDDEPVAIWAAGRPFKIATLPGDTLWATYVRNQVDYGITALQRLIGVPWPGGLETIREDPSIDVTGFAGFFGRSPHELTLIEAPSQQLIFHEVSHAWFAPRTVGSRWVAEGLGDYLAEQVMTKVTGKPPYAYQADRASKAAEPLNSWPAKPHSGPSEDYAYAASAKVMQTLFDGVSDADRAAVLSGALKRESAYDPPGSLPLDHRTINWQNFLDLLESRGHIASAPEVFRTWVLDPEEAKLLPARASARANYAKLDAANGAWQPPVALRTAMTKWMFPEAGWQMAALTPLNKDAVAVQVAAKKSGLPVPKPLLAGYADADLRDEVAALAKTLPTAAKALNDVGAATKYVAGRHNPLTALGATVLRVDKSATEARSALASGDYATASSSARKAATAVSLAAAVGAIILAGGLALIGFVLTLGWRWSRRFTRRPARPQPVPES